MKKWIIGGLALATLIVGAFMFASPAMAQRDGPRSLQFDGLVLEGPGSSIGASVRDLGADEAARAKVQPSDGVLVDSVREGTPASKAGLKSGDVIIEFDGERLRSTRHFTRLVRETPPGRTVKMTIMRDGSRRTLDITPEASNRSGGFPDAALRALPRDFQFNFDGNRNFFFEGPFGSTARLGVVVTPLSDQLAAYFGVKDGVLVSEVEANTPAASAGVKAGDVITSVNGHSITSPQEVVNEVRNVQAGGAIDLKITRDRKELSLKATIPERRRPSAGGQPI
jgi:S1-C subfamily serine protease